MPRSDLFLKVEIEHGTSEQPDAVAAELCRVLMKRPGVRSADVSSVMTHTEE